MGVTEYYTQNMHEIWVAHKARDSLVQENEEILQYPPHLLGHPPFFCLSRGKIDIMETPLGSLNFLH